MCLSKHRAVIYAVLKKVFVKWYRESEKHHSRLQVKNVEVSEKVKKSKKQTRFFAAIHTEKGLGRSKP